MKVKVGIRHYGLGPGSWHIYSAMGTAPNADIFVGVCDYSLAFKMSDRPGGAHLLRYDPEEDTMHDLGDMQDITSQRALAKLIPQSKIHTPIVFDSSGKAYFGTHSVERDYLPPEYKDSFPGGYPGGHWVSYDPASGEMEDLGIAVEGESLMGLTMDAARNRLYATTHKKALLVGYDIAAKHTEVLGGIGKYPTRTVAHLAHGRVYTFDDRGHLLRHEPGAGSIERSEMRVPNGGFEADLITVFALCTDPSRSRLYGLSSLLHGEKQERRGGYLFEYVPHARGWGTLTDLGRAGISDVASVEESELYHAMTFGTDGKIYYTAPTKGKPVHLVSYDPSTEEKLDHGEMWAEGLNVSVLAAFAATTGKDGTLYFGGLLRWEEDPKWKHEAVLMVVRPKEL